jgi:hypothetical protein
MDSDLKKYYIILFIYFYGTRVMKKSNMSRLG